MSGLTVFFDLYIKFLMKNDEFGFESANRELYYYPVFSRMMQLLEADAEIKSFLSLHAICYDKGDMAATKAEMKFQISQVTSCTPNTRQHWRDLLADPEVGQKVSFE